MSKKEEGMKLMRAQEADESMHNASAVTRKKEEAEIVAAVKQKNLEGDRKMDFERSVEQAVEDAKNKEMIYQYISRGIKTSPNVIMMILSISIFKSNNTCKMRNRIDIIQNKGQIMAREKYPHYKMIYKTKSTKNEINENENPHYKVISTIESTEN